MIKFLFPACVDSEKDENFEDDLVKYALGVTKTWPNGYEMDVKLEEEVLPAKGDKPKKCMFIPTIMCAQICFILLLIVNFSNVAGGSNEVEDFKSEVKTSAEELDRECYDLPKLEDNKWSKIMTKVDSNCFDAYEHNLGASDESSADLDQEEESSDGEVKKKNSLELCRFCGAILTQHLIRHVMEVHKKEEIFKEAERCERLPYLYDELLVFSKHTLKPKTNIVKPGQTRCKGCGRVGTSSNAARHRKNCLQSLLRVQLKEKAMAANEKACGVLIELRTLRSKSRVKFFEKVPEAVAFLKRKYDSLAYIFFGNLTIYRSVLVSATMVQRQLGKKSHSMQ